MSTLKTYYIAKKKCTRCGKGLIQVDGDLFYCIHPTCYLGLIKIDEIEKRYIILDHKEAEPEVDNSERTGKIKSERWTNLINQTMKLCDCWCWDCKAGDHGLCDYQCDKNNFEESLKEEDEEAD